MATVTRRYDIDWIRVIAIGLLLIYHISIGFQRWGIMLGFITNEKSWDSLWTPMSMLNIWRIPLLFFVSGMGVYFAIQNRNWKQLIQERAFRILLPFLFGAICIYPLSNYIWQRYYQWQSTYSPNPGHLWFLGNIFAYVILLLSVFFYLKKNENGNTGRIIKKILSSPLGLLPVILASIAEAWLVDPNTYTMYAMTWHGFFLGLITFFFGFCFVLSGDGFWNMLLKFRWMFSIIATGLFIHRLYQFQMRVPVSLLVVESDCWIFTVFAFGYKYLNRPGKVLAYLSQAVLPVYIVHMIFLSLASWLIFSLKIDIRVQFILVLLTTFAGCFGSYELIRRVNFIRPLFGLRMKDNQSTTPDKKVSALT